MLEIDAIILGVATITVQAITLKELVCMDRYLKAKSKQEAEEYQKQQQEEDDKYKKTRPTEDDEAIEKFIDDYLSVSEKNRH